MSILRLDSVSVHQGNRAILRDVNWVIEEGEHWAVIGGNGAGKTTLLNVINGYIWPRRGSVEVLGHTYGHVNLSELRQRIGSVSTSMTEWFCRSYPRESALSVVISGKFASVGLWQEKTSADEARAMELLRLFQAVHLRNQSFESLSQGEKQRVLIARAWMANPQLLILDEPCTGLDLKARESLLDTIQQLASEPDHPTFIYVSHHVEEILPFFTHTLLLQNGKLLSQGRKRDVITPDFIRRAFDVNVDIEWHSERPWIYVSKEASC